MNFFVCLVVHLYINLGKSENFDKPMMEVRSGNVAKLVNRLSRDLSQLNKTTTAPSVDVSFRRSVSVLSGNSCLMHVHPPRET
ncbi:unnamed protein product [Brugia timori]|uniref:Secreted protein n=1 Tax=Brugia timori TaxID=42155 RepID=A0A0R3QUF1_9BILA|nr:unnamed protein product [Brugia timori]